MENQHRKVQGYRDFDQSTLDAINSIKSAEKDIGQLFKQIKAKGDVDQRSLSLAKTKLQEGFSWLVRAVAQPEDVFEGSAPEPETFLTRLLAERDRTISDLERLTAFISSDRFQHLSLEKQDDMQAQKRIMTELALILSKRYDDHSQ